MDETNKAHDAIQEAFLNNIFLLFKYKTYTPGDVIINFRLTLPQRRNPPQHTSFLGAVLFKQSDRSFRFWPGAHLSRNQPIHTH